MSNVFTVDDLPKLNCGKKFAVFGKPIAHSLSPLMQNVALQEIAKTDSTYNNAKYFAFEVDPNNLKETLDVFWQQQFIGINLTIPHKEVVMNIVSDFDDSAKQATACNTLLRTPEGWRGFNTDGFGITGALESQFNRQLADSNVVMIGAGGAAKGAAATILRANCKKLTVANRTLERLNSFAEMFKGSNLKICSLDNIESAIEDGSIIINATSIGLKADDKPVIDFGKIGKNCVFLDMPYVKKTMTASVKSAKDKGILAQDGLAMLAYQGAKSLSIWTDKPLLGELMLKTLQGE